jgi:hypothetical protein
MKYTVIAIVLLAVGMVSAKQPRIEKILLPDTIKGKYNTVISIDTMKITHHLLDTVMEISADTTILKCKNVTVLQEPKKDVVGPPVIPVKK